MPTITEFKKYFSIPREPNTALSPNQFFDYKVLKGKKVVITDIYIENLGGGDACLEILEQKLQTTFEFRYAYKTTPNQVLNINFSTGLRLGDETAIFDKIRMMNSTGSSANLLIRVNGQLVG